MYCHNFHVVLSDGDFFFARLICDIHGSSLTWWPCLPISFLFFTGTCSTFLGMRASIHLSLVGLLVMSSRHLCDISWSGVLLIILMFSEIFILIGKYRPYTSTVSSATAWPLSCVVHCSCNNLWICISRNTAKNKSTVKWRLLLLSLRKK